MNTKVHLYLQYIYYTVAPATSYYAIVYKTQQYMYLIFLYYILAVYAWF